MFLRDVYAKDIYLANQCSLLKEEKGSTNKYKEICVLLFACLHLAYLFKNKQQKHTQQQPKRNSVRWVHAKGDQLATLPMTLVN